MSSAYVHLIPRLSSDRLFSLRLHVLKALYILHILSLRLKSTLTCTLAHTCAQARLLANATTTTTPSLISDSEPLYLCLHGYNTALWESVRREGDLSGKPRSPNLRAEADNPREREVTSGTEAEVRKFS